MDLVCGKINMVGVIIFYNDYLWFDKIVNGILEVVFKNCYLVMFFLIGYDLKEEEKYLMCFKMK